MISLYQQVLILEYPSVILSARLFVFLQDSGRTARPMFMKFGTYAVYMKVRKSIVFDTIWLTLGRVMGDKFHEYNVGDFARIWYIGFLEADQGDWIWPESVDPWKSGGVNGCMHVTWKISFNLWPIKVYRYRIFRKILSDFLLVRIQNIRQNNCQKCLHSTCWCCSAT